MTGSDPPAYCSRCLACEASSELGVEELDPSLWPVIDAAGVKEDEGHRISAMQGVPGERVMVTLVGSGFPR